MKLGDGFKEMAGENRLDFGHFGGGRELHDNKLEWMNTIISFMEKSAYPNLCGRCSLLHLTGQMQRVQAIVRKNDVADRVMFGTDFIMIMRESKCGACENYFNNFESTSERIPRSSAPGSINPSM